MIRISEQKIACHTYTRPKVCLVSIYFEFLFIMLPFTSNSFYIFIRNIYCNNSFKIGVFFSFKPYNFFQVTVYEQKQLLSKKVLEVCFVHMVHTTEFPARLSVFQEEPRYIFIAFNILS